MQRPVSNFPQINEITNEAWTRAETYMNVCQHVLQVMLGTFVQHADLIVSLSDILLNAVSES